MIVLGLDCSSAEGSLALLDDDTVRAETRWAHSRSAGQRLFQLWPHLLQEAGLTPAAIELYVCGRGPGSFSGVRVALAAARAAALPFQRPVTAVSSGEAIARSVAADTGANRIAVAGDARRQTLWLGTFERHGHGVRPAGDWTLASPETFTAHVAPGTLCVTPEWDRLRRILPPESFTTRTWIEGDCYPTAQAVARAGLQQLREGREPEPLRPLYLHPAVRK